MAEIAAVRMVIVLVGVNGRKEDELEFYIAVSLIFDRELRLTRLISQSALPDWILRNEQRPYQEMTGFFVREEKLEEKIKRKRKEKKRGEI